jgi:integrase
MANAWIFQKLEDVHKLGEAAAPYYVGWYEPDGRRRKKSCGTGFQGKKIAEKLKRKLEAELMTGTYKMHAQKLWADFRQEYERRHLAGLAVRSLEQANFALDHFERIVKPVRVFPINTGHIDDFIAARRQEPGKKRGSLVSPASVNSDLRHIKAALRTAHEWGYLHQVPRFHMEKVPKRLPTYFTAEHFAAVYTAADVAKKPRGQPYPPSDWWRALLVMGCMTGWRIGDMMGLKRDDLDLEAGTAITRHEDNKGKRDERVKLHPVVVEHLKRLAGFDPHVFPWAHYELTLRSQFATIQEKAGVHLHCPGQHEHTRFCHVYGFHDLRRAFATMNAAKLTPDALQSLMRHKSYQTTQIYINMARQMDEAVASLHVPDVLKQAGTGGAG